MKLVASRFNSERNIPIKIGASHAGVHLRAEGDSYNLSTESG